jgi:hypothetical protein
MQPDLDGYNQSVSENQYVASTSPNGCVTPTESTSNPAQNNPTKPRSPLDKKVNEHCINQFSSQSPVFLPQSKRKWSKNPKIMDFFFDTAAFARFVQQEAAEVRQLAQAAHQEKVYNDYMEKKEDIADQLLRGRFENNT